MATRALVTIVANKGGDSGEYNVMAYGAAGDGATDDRAAVNTAITEATSLGGYVYFPQGTYKISSNLTIECHCVFVEGAILSIDNGIVVTITGNLDAKAFQIFSGLGTVSFAGNIVETEVYPQWWGATGDGSTDDRTAINAAQTAVGVGKAIYFPPGTYRVSSNLTISSDVIFASGAKLSIDTGVVVTITGALTAPMQQIVSGVGTVSFTGNTKLKEVYPQWWGVTGDGSTDDTAAFQASATACVTGASVFYISKGMNICLTAPVTMWMIRDIVALGTLTIKHNTSPAITAGYTSVGPVPVDLYFQYIARGTGSTTNILLRLQGLKQADVKVDSCAYVQLYTDGSIAAISGIAYSNFRWGIITKLELYGEAGTSWINENTHYGGRFNSILIDAVTYQHNQNIFIKPCVEGGSITINKGVNNSFYDTRSESGATVTFASGTYHNIIIDRFQSNYAVIGSGFTVTDNGWENVVAGSMGNQYIRENLVHLDKTSLIFDSCGEYTDTDEFMPGLSNLQTANNYNIYFTTPVISVSILKRFLMYSSIAKWRPRVICYDANMNVLDGTAPWYIASYGGWAAQAGYYAPGANVAYMNVIFNNPDVVYAQMAFQHGAGVNSVEYLGIDVYYNRTTSSNATRDLKQIKQAMRLPLVQANAPTQGLAQVGQVVSCTNGKTSWTNTKLIDITTTEEVSIAETDIDVSSGTGIEIGDVVGLLLDDLTTHWTSVTNIATNTVTVATGPASASASGSRIIFNKWVGGGVKGFISGDATPSVLGGDVFVTCNSVLAIGSTDTKVSSTAFNFVVSGVMYSKVANAVGTTLAAGTIPQDKWGVYKLCIGVDGTIDCLPGAANFTTGYDNEAAAISALPATTASHVAIGYFTVQTKTGTTFIGGTDALQGGVSGNVSNDTNYYNMVGTASGEVTITNFDDAVLGSRFTVICDAGTTIKFLASSTLKGNAGADWTPDLNDFMNCVYAGAFKYCEVVDVNP